MRHYLQNRRRKFPEIEMLRRAEKRAAQLKIDFSLTAPPPIPERCPVLGLRLTPGGRRSNTSPSLDRLDPGRGYVDGNVRVISDRANRLKGDRTLAELQAHSIVGATSRRADFALVAKYVEREQLLMDVRVRAGREGGTGEWSKLADFLDRVFRNLVPSEAKDTVPKTEAR